jgi:hypothetical protein
MPSGEVCGCLKEISSDESVIGHCRSQVDSGYFKLGHGSIPNRDACKRTLEEAVEVSRPNPQRCCAALRINHSFVNIGISERTIAIDVCRLAIGNAYNVYPAPSFDRVLKVAAYAFPAPRVENVEADAIRLALRVARAIEPQDPLVNACFAFTHPALARRPLTENQWWQR